MADRTFAFVDLSGFTALTDAHGDEEAMATLQRFRKCTEESLAPGDLLVKTIGDAVMLAFPNPNAAVAALGRLFNAACTDANMPLIRGGVHHGPAIEADDDFFGGTVNLAARVAAQAAGGQLLATTEVALAGRDVGAVVTHVGLVSLRNIAEPVDLFEIEFNPSEDVVLDPVCAMKVPRSGPSSIHLRVGDRDVWFCGLACVATWAQNPERFS